MASTAAPATAHSLSPPAPRWLGARSASPPAPGHHFTVDVEEYFQVSAFEPVVQRAEWHRYPTRVEPAVRRLLDLLAQSETRGTFFVLGWLAAGRPELVRRIADAGHEIASHGWDHRRVTEQTPDEFRRSVRYTKGLLEDLTGQPVLGFRAPSFSIVPGREWALDVLIEAGYQYDSSLFPVLRPGYGYPRGGRDPHWVQRHGGCIAEIPPTTLRRLGVNLPAAGGAYFRLLPYHLTRAAFRECQRRRVPGTFYIHPWELDQDQPRMAVPWLTRWRHYGGIERTEAHLRRLLAEFRFGAVADTLSTW